jgi:DNA-binding Lrp family transcriptional regulator
MKKNQRVLRQILYWVFEQNKRFMSQKAISEACGVSLGTVNPIINRLERLGGVEKKPLGFSVIDVGRVLMYWANTRDLEADVVYSASSHLPARDIEKSLPPGSILTAFSGFRAKLGSAPVEYREVHVYANPAEIKRMFPPRRGRRENVIVLKPDEHLMKLSKDGVAPIGQLYVDLWQLGGPAKIFVDGLSSHMRLAEVEAIKGVIRRARESSR